MKKSFKSKILQNFSIKIYGEKWTTNSQKGEIIGYGHKFVDQYVILIINHNFHIYSVGKKKQSG